LILNFPQAFEHYAAHWMIPLMRLVTKGARFGEPMNYYVQDLCIVLITWGSQTPFPEDIESKHALLEFLVKSHLLFFFPKKEKVINYMIIRDF
jgi:hypothetical protein